MQAIKSIVAATFLGAFGLGFIGIFIGALAVLITSPESNLGPPVGAVCGLFLGLLIGAVLGFAFGIIRSFRSKPRVPHGNSEENAKTP